MGKRKKHSVFGTGRKLRLGIWGLGRGMSFYNSCAALNIEVVAGCDYSERLRTWFLKCCPNALATADAAEFLAADMDAVLVATFCPAHADDVIACLKAGKHVLSEVTSFHTMAEGVRLVEAVEKSGLVYNLAENVPFNKANMFLASKWKEGLFGDLMYAEYEYVHECRRLVYAYNGGGPVMPGYTVHNWRSWISFHYYNTHSLGPVMHIAGVRPVRVVALPGAQRLAGYLMATARGMAGISPSLITMDNGAIMRNLMGATTNDSHMQRLWGTRGSAEMVDGHLRLRLGAAGVSPKMEVEPDWVEHAQLAEKTGHGGGDFWVLYFFARQILTGEPAPFDVYTAADCTIPGILAYRSSLENGKPLDVPDFRKKRDRNKYRRDNFAQKRYDVRKGCFPRNADKKLTGRFTAIMCDLIRYATIYRACADWEQVVEYVKEPAAVIGLADRLVEEYPEMRKAMKAARKLADAYPRSDGAKVIREMLELADEETTTCPRFLKGLKKRRASLKRRFR